MDMWSLQVTKNFSGLPHNHTFMFNTDWVWWDTEK